MNICLVDIMRKVRATSVRISANSIHPGRSASKINISTISK
jgi:hypothetical protein